MTLKVINWVFLAIAAIAVAAGGGLILTLNQKVDMTGGRYIVYKIDNSELEPEELDTITRKTVEVLKKRVDGKNVLKLAWIPRSDSIFEVRIPLPDESVKRKYEAYKQAVTQLEMQNVDPGDAMWYHILEEIPEEIKKDRAKHDAVKKYFKALDKYIAYLGIYDPVKNNFDPDYIKHKITQASYLDFRILPTLEHPDTGKIEVEKYVELLETKGPRETSDENFVWCEIKSNNQWNVIHSIIGSYDDKHYVLASNNPDECMLSGPRANWKIDRVSKSYDQMGRPAVAFMLDKNGGELLGALTEKNIDRPLCILLDNIALSAPFVESRVGRNGMIVGSLSTEEVDRIVDYLEAGALSVTIVKRPFSEGLINPDIKQKPGG
ncbi:MAG TPA: hypothetical protein DIU00_21885 [Phycisphaerales bacterium]|nr:hypothetical protein [Phycisphaerales bacterium]